MSLPRYPIDVRVGPYSKLVGGVAKHQPNPEAFDNLDSPNLGECSCVAFFPLPEPTPGFEEIFEELSTKGVKFPTHVHKTSCRWREGGEQRPETSHSYWRAGVYTAGEPQKPVDTADGPRAPTKAAAGAALFASALSIDTDEGYNLEAVTADRFEAATVGQEWFLY